MLGLKFKPIETFTWQSPDNTAAGTWAVSEILAAILTKKLKFYTVVTTVDPLFATTWLRLRDLNFHHIHSMTEAEIETPVLAVDLKDKTTLLIDGSHRYMARYLRQKSTITMIIIPYPDWKPWATGEGL